MSMNIVQNRPFQIHAKNFHAAELPHLPCHRKPKTDADKDFPAEIVDTQLSIYLKSTDHLSIEAKNCVRSGGSWCGDGMAGAY
jgi:hypothetical protein